MNPLKKVKIVAKIFFSDNVEWSLRNFWKIVSSDVKPNVKLQEIKELFPVSFKFLYEVPTKSEIQCKKGIFHLILVSIPSSLILSVKNRGSGGYSTDKIC